VWAVVWSEEFNSWLKETLQNFVTGDGDIVGTIEEINAKITALNQQYGIGG
jgi:multiple sugar transport system substrate-binding protein